MSTWKVELGFDWNALVHPEKNDGERYLQWGVVNNGGDSTLNNVRKGDTVTFHIYDVTALTSQTNSGSTAEVHNDPPAWITTLAGDTMTEFASPFSDETLATLQGTMIENPEPVIRQSFTFNGGYFPSWSLGIGSAITVSNPGSFLLTFRIKANRDGDVRTFRVDPEMVVTTGGG